MVTVMVIMVILIMLMVIMVMVVLVIILISLQQPFTRLNWNRAPHQSCWQSDEEVMMRGVEEMEMRWTRWWGGRGGRRRRGRSPLFQIQSFGGRGEEYHDGDDDENEGEMRMQEREVDIWKGGRLDDGRWRWWWDLGEELVMVHHGACEGVHISLEKGLNWSQHHKLGEETLRVTTCARVRHSVAVLRGFGEVQCNTVQLWLHRCWGALVGEVTRGSWRHPRFSSLWSHLLCLSGVIFSAMPNTVHSAHVGVGLTLYTKECTMRTIAHSTHIIHCTYCSGYIVHSEDVITLTHYVWVLSDSSLHLA